MGVGCIEGDEEVPSVCTLRFGAKRYCDNGYECESSALDAIVGNSFCCQYECKSSVSTFLLR